MPDAPGAQTTRTLTREDVVRAGQAGRPWDFLPVVARALEIAPADHGLRFLAAVNLARLGLRTLALEQLGQLPGHEDVGTLRGAVERLPEDRATPPRVAMVGGVRVEGVAVSECFRTLDGNVVSRRLGAEPGVLGEARFVNEAGLGRALVESVRQRNAADLSRVVLDGFSANLFRTLYEATPTSGIGFTPRIMIVQRDGVELLEQLAGVDLAGDLGRMLADPRVELFIGEDGAARLLSALRGRMGCSLPTMVLPSPATRAWCTLGVGKAASLALEEQRAEFETLHARVTAAYASRDEAYWRRRFAAGSKLRVLIPTTRFSTYVQHAAGDLAAAFTRGGHEARVLMEPDDYSQLGGVAYLRAFEDLEPDLVVTINYPRATRGASVPANVPYVTWVQDAMPHLFDAKIGRAHGPMDFIVGHAFADLFQKHEYPLERLLPMSLVADPEKFHRGPVAPATSARHTCDLAFVSHHSETPEAMFARLHTDMREHPAVQRAFESLWPEVQRLARAAATECVQLKLREASMECLRRTLGREPDPRAHAAIFQHGALPLVDRLMRHETLAWAAGIARRRGLRLHLYGRGWDKHPTLAEFARGELPHGEELRASYRCAGVHLHVSGTALVHQRVVECYLAGGFCAARLFRDAHGGLRTSAELATMSRPPDVVDEAGGRVGYVIADHAEFMELANHLARLGHPHDGPVMWFPRSRRDNQLKLRPTLAADHDPSLLLRDVRETTFQTESELEALVVRALSDGAWREAVCGMVTKAARQHLTTDVLVERMIRLVGGSFAERGAGATSVEGRTP